MKKALLITLDFPPAIGGVALYYSNLCDRLPVDKIAVLAPHRKNEKEFDTKRKYKIFRGNLVYNYMWPKWLNAYCLAKASLKSSKADTILVGQVLPIGYIAYRLKQKKGIPYGVFCHGMDVAMQNINSHKKKWRKKILVSADYVFANSQFTKKILLEMGINENKIHIINPCPATSTEIDKQRLLQIKNEYNLQDKKVLLYVGRLTKRKGIDLVIKSLPSIVKTLPNLVYAIIGDGPERENLETLVRESNLEKHVIFTGAQDISEVKYYFNLADLFIMTTRPSKEGDLESFGMVYLEANQYGLATIATDVGGVSETVVNNETGFLLDSGDQEVIAKAVIELFTNSGLKSKLGEQGKQRVKTTFQWKKQADQLEGIL